MSLTATGLTMGWSGVTVTPATGTAISLTEVTEIQLEKKAVPKSFFGDVNAYPQMIVARQKSRELSIKGGDVAKLAGIPEGSVCTIVAVLNDARNGAGAGAITVNLNNAVCVSNPFSGPVNEFATGTVSFASYSVDGTDPLTLTVA